MSGRRRILLYGSSLVLDGIATSLLTEERFEVIRLPQPLLQMSDAGALAPDVIIFDTETSDSAVLFSALATRPDLVLLEVSSDKNVVRLWSGQEHRELSITDLAALIEVDRQAMVCPTANVVTARERQGDLR